MGPGANRPFEVCSQRRVVLSDERHRLTNRAGDADPGTFRRDPGAAIAPTEAHRARELARQELVLASRL